MNHYEVLGVARSASSTDVRKAYLELARLHHPDRGIGSGSASASAGDGDGDADGRMREINAAWNTLRDADRRFEYDQKLAYRDGVGPRFGAGADGAGGAGGAGPGFVDPGHQAHRRTRPENATSPGWSPIDDGEDDGIDLDLLDDTPVEGTALPRWLQVAPAFLLIAGLVGLCIGLIASIAALAVLGITFVVLSGVMFLAVPVFAVFNSRSHDPNP